MHRTNYCSRDASVAIFFVSGDAGVAATTDYYANAPSIASVSCWSTSGVLT